LRSPTDQEEAMARTVRRFATLAVIIVVVAGGRGTNRSFSQALGDGEAAPEPNGKKVFERETFGGNGRTCRTCHSKLTGALTLADVQQVIEKADPDDRLLIEDALDDDGVGTTRVQTHATIRYTIPLPPWVSLADDPAATRVSVFRGVPSTRNTPALDPVLLHDGRAPSLQDQALGAIHDHYRNTVEPTTAQLDAVADFERTDAHFFSSDELRRFAAGGPPPELPPGITAAEQRGRRFLVDAPFAPPSKDGICALCHSGPMLNQTNIHHQNFAGGRPRAGVRFFGTGVNVVNTPNNPIRRWVVNDGINPVVIIDSPDPGLLLHPNPPTPPPSLVPRAFFADQFKIPTLWGVKDTAPYFHDNGARTLRDAVAHYQRFFNFTDAQDPVGSASLGGFIVLSDSDVDDIVAYLNLLGPNGTAR
jgi:cytochrome c peroxidase